jgi:hypothetical protein
MLLTMTAHAAARQASELPSTVVAVRMPFLADASPPRAPCKDEAEPSPPASPLGAVCSLAKGAPPASEAAHFVQLTERRGLLAAVQSSTSPGVMWRTALELRRVVKMHESTTYVTTSLLLVQSKVQQIHLLVNELEGECARLPKVAGAPPVPPQIAYGKLVRAAVERVHSQDLLVPAQLEGEEGKAPTGAPLRVLKSLLKDASVAAAAVSLVLYFYFEERAAQNSKLSSAFIYWCGNFALALYRAYLDLDSDPFTEVSTRPTCGIVAPGVPVARLCELAVDVPLTPCACVSDLCACPLAARRRGLASVLDESHAGVPTLQPAAPALLHSSADGDSRAENILQAVRDGDRKDADRDRAHRAQERRAGDR